MLTKLMSLMMVFLSLSQANLERIAGQAGMGGPLW